MANFPGCQPTRDPAFRGYVGVALRREKFLKDCPQDQLWALRNLLLPVTRPALSCRKQIQTRDSVEQIAPSVNGWGRGLLFHRLDDAPVSSGFLKCRPPALGRLYSQRFWCGCWTLSVTWYWGAVGGRSCLTSQDGTATGCLVTWQSGRKNAAHKVRGPGQEHGRKALGLSKTC